VEAGQHIEKEKEKGQLHLRIHSIAAQHGPQSSFSQLQEVVYGFLAEYFKYCANTQLKRKCVRTLEAELLENDDALSSPMKGRGKRQRREFEKLKPEPFSRRSLPAKP